MKMAFEPNKGIGHAVSGRVTGSSKPGTQAGRSMLLEEQHEG